MTKDKTQSPNFGPESDRGDSWWTIPMKPYPVCRLISGLWWKWLLMRWFPQQCLFKHPMTPPIDYLHTPCIWTVTSWSTFDPTAAVTELAEYSHNGASSTSSENVQQAHSWMQCECLWGSNSLSMQVNSLCWFSCRSVWHWAIAYELAHLRPLQAGI